MNLEIAQMRLLDTEWMDPASNFGNGKAMGIALQGARSPLACVNSDEVMIRCQSQSMPHIGHSIVTAFGCAASRRFQRSSYLKVLPLELQA